MDTMTDENKVSISGSVVATALQVLIAIISATIFISTTKQSTVELKEVIETVKKEQAEQRSMIDALKLEVVELKAELRFERERHDANPTR